MSAAASKHRQPRLRASCDGCFLAKVKCSKARPICSRCLACGIECRYSPSSRAGKPKSDSSGNHNHHHNNSHGSNVTNGHLSHHAGHHHHHHQGSPIQQDMSAVSAGFSPMTDDKSGLIYAAAVSGMAPPGLYRLDTGWHTPSSMDLPPGSAISRNHSISSELALLAMDENAAAMAAAANGDPCAAGAVPWSTPPTDLSVTQFADSPIGGIPMHTAATHGHFAMSAAVVAAASSGMPWMDPSVMDMFPCGPGQHIQSHSQQPPQQQMPTPGSIGSSANNYFPSPSTTPSLRQSPATGHKAAPNAVYFPNSSTHQAQIHGGQNGSQNGNVQHATCVCFTACLHALQALHNASTPAAPPFDVVLALNRNAVEGCAAMLACSRCMSRSGMHTAAMLLATLLGKITSFYKTASQSYLGGEDESMEQAALGNASESAEHVAETANTQTLSAAAAAAPIATGATSPSAGPTMAGGAGGVAGLGVSLGAYQLQGEDGRWLELEILHRELKKLEEVYARFREVCGEVLFEDVAVSNAMIGYLGQTLGTALDLVNHRRGDLQFV